jgi:non-canonical purine NTP pyrophosphatase (RdgB/HAM1 family)
MPKHIHLVTSNQRKVDDYNRRINLPNLEIVRLNVDLDEGRSLDIQEIANIKLQQAKKLFPNKAILVEDRGFFIPALNNFPGPFVKIFLKSIGIEGVLKLMESKEDRTALFITVLAYFDGNTDHFFVDTEIGFLGLTAKGNNIRGWTDILYIYGHEAFPNKSLAELNDEEWSKYLEKIEVNDYINQFLSFVQTN